MTQDQRNAIRTTLNLVGTVLIIVGTGPFVYLVFISLISGAYKLSTLFGYVTNLRFTWFCWLPIISGLVIIRLARRFASSDQEPVSEASE